MDRDRLLEKVKAKTFIGKNAAFLGCLLCNLNFKWSEELETAGVSKKDFLWNPKFFDSLIDSEREFVLLHELWHIALLHLPRMGNRDIELWNIATDIRINNDLIREGYHMPEGGLSDDQYQNDEWTEEKIYEDLLRKADEYSTQTWGSKLDPSKDNLDPLDQVAVVQQAVTASKLSSKDAGKGTGKVENLLKEFLKPKLSWRHLLHKFFFEKMEPEWSWSKPNRRFREVYLPSLLADENRLTSIAMFLDTSGSISPEEIQRFISEVKFVKHNLNPKKLSVIQFDWCIQKIDEYGENDKLKEFKIRGYGGTSYSEVQEYIVKHKPTLSIIFTDLHADPMDPVGKNEVIWVVSNNPKATVPFGEVVHVSD